MSTIASAADENRPVISGVSHGLAIDDTYEGAQIFYTRSDSRGIVITGCKTTKPGTTIRIPKQIEGRDVVAIARNAFKNQTNIKFVQFYGCNTLYGTQYHPGGSSYGPVLFKGASAITEIGEGAFEGCKNLTSVLVGNKELTVSDDAFYECTNLSYISFCKESGTSVDPVYGNIGNYAFFRSGITSLGDNFSVAKCKKIGSYAFNGCNNLKTVNVKATEISEGCFDGCDNLKDAKLDCPTIGYEAFYNCLGLETVTLSNTKTIDDHAFELCTSLKSAPIPNSIEFIGKLAFHGDSKLTTPALFVKENGKKLTIDTAAFEGTGIEYTAFSGDITVGDYAFMHCNLKCAVVEGNVKLSGGSVGYNNWKKVPGFTMYGNANSNTYASRSGIPYVKVDTNKSYDNMMNELKPYFMRMNATQFGNDKGCCAGVAIAQVLTYTKKLNWSDWFPAKYNGKQITSFLDVPENANTANIPEFQKYITDVYNYWKNQNYYLFYNKKCGYEITLTPETIDGYAKLTEYGIVLPAALHVYNHNHSVAIFGVEKLKTPVQIKDDISNTTKTYNYRMIISENGYSFKEQNGKLVAKGCDHFTWWPGCQDNEGWIPVEDTYIYVSTNSGTVGDCYQQRWDKGKNVKPNAKLSTLNDYDMLLASDFGTGKK